MILVASVCMLFFGEPVSCSKPTTDVKNVCEKVETLNEFNRKAGVRQEYWAKIEMVKK